MQLLRNIYLVGGRSFFLTMRADADCNVYAVRTDAGIVLVDCGYNEASLTAIFDTLRYWGMDPADVRYVLLNHAHFDHTGNARALQARGVELVAHRLTAEALVGGDERTIHYAFYRGDFPTCEVDRLLDDRETIEVGGWRFEAIHVPGHADGNTVFLTERDGRRVLFAGDLVFHERPPTVEETLAWNGGTEFDSDLFLDSLIELQRLRVDALLPGHNGFLLADGSAMIDHALVVALRAWGNGYAERRGRRASA